MQSESNSQALRLAVVFMCFNASLVLYCDQAPSIQKRAITSLKVHWSSIDGMDPSRASREVDELIKDYETARDGGTAGGGYDRLMGILETFKVRERNKLYSGVAIDTGARERILASFNEIPLDTLAYRN